MATLGAMNDDDDEHQDVVKAQIQSLIDQAKTVAEQGLIVSDINDVARSAAQLDRRVRFKAGKPAGATLVTIIKAHLANRT